MKRFNALTLAATLGGWLLAVETSAQDPAPPASENPPPAPAPPAPAATSTNLVEAAEDTTRLPPTVAPLLVSPPPVPLTPSRYGGVIGQALESRQPWQLFNPLAPPEFGDGTQNLSVNPVTGQAEGVTLFSFQFKSKPGAKKNTRRAVAPER
jgi:hypothetical protein